MKYQKEFSNLRKFYEMWQQADSEYRRAVDFEPKLDIARWRAFFALKEHLFERLCKRHPTFSRVPFFWPFIAAGRLQEIMDEYAKIKLMDEKKRLERLEAKMIESES